jgi:hypothetical protein
MLGALSLRSFTSSSVKAVPHRRTSNSLGLRRYTFKEEAEGF